MSSAATWPVFTAKLRSREEVAEGTMAFHFEKPVDWTFNAGQFIDITLLDPSETDAEGNTRGFSIASSPYEETRMVVTPHVRYGVQTSVKQDAVWHRNQNQARRNSRREIDTTRHVQK